MPRKLTEAGIEARRKYRAENVKGFHISFFPADADIYEHLQQQENKTAYIKNLIRKDMNENKPPQ